ncbi:hypothetical protein L1887_39052 [Cichorium endivia]|nr:hypothetical protein L1887_39052 [Cichorium endivia]
MKGTEISNARFWAIVVHAHYQQAGYVLDVSLPELRYTPIAIPPLDDEPTPFCAQIPQAMLSKVPMECNEVNTYRNTLVIPYPTRDLSQEAPVEAQPKGKGKRKVTGGPSCAKKADKKRKTSEQTTPKRKQPKRTRKLTIVDESSESERTPSTVQEEEQEEQHDDQPPSPPPTTRPPTLPHTTAPPSPPKTTKPPTSPHTTTPPPPPTTAQQTTLIHTTSSDVPPPPPHTTAPRTSTIPFSGIDFSVPDFDPSQSPSRQNPTSAAFFEAFHLAPLVAKGTSDEELPDEAFVLMQQYKILNSKLDTLIQAQTGFNPTKPTMGDITEEIESLEVTLSKEIKDSSVVADIDKKIGAFAEKAEQSYSEVMKALQELRSETQKSTKFEKQLDEARAKIKELTAAKAASEMSKFTEELQRTIAVLNQDMTIRLRTVLQPLINFADRLTRPQGRPAIAQHAGHASQGGERPRLTSAATTTTAGPTFSTITTTTMGTSGACGSAGAGSSTNRSTESIIAPHMENIFKARRADYALMIKMNNFARDDGKWTAEAIKIFRFQDLNVLNRLPLRSFETVDSEDIQLDIPFNPKTFSFLQFVQSITYEQRPTYWTNKINFHDMFIQHQSEFLVLRGADEVESRFTIVDFPIMNPIVFIQILDLLRRNDAVDLDEPYGVVFKGLRNETEVMIKFFEIDYLGLHPSSFISGMIPHVNACQVNSEEKKKKFMDHMNCADVSEVPSEDLLKKNPKVINQLKTPKSEDSEGYHLEDPKTS